MLTYGINCNMIFGRCWGDNMTMKKKQILEEDLTLRFIYAFNYFADINSTWEEDSYYTEHNRKISEQMGLVIEDAYFIFGGLFYSFNYQRIDDNTIMCEMKEYDNHYDLASTISLMHFNFNVVTKEVEILLESIKIVNKINEQYQKTKKVA